MKVAAFKADLHHNATLMARIAADYSGAATALQNAREPAKSIRARKKMAEVVEEMRVFRDDLSRILADHGMNIEPLPAPIKSAVRQRAYAQRQLGARRQAPARLRPMDRRGRSPQKENNETSSILQRRRCAAPQVLGRGEAA